MLESLQSIENEVQLLRRQKSASDQRQKSASDQEIKSGAERQGSVGVWRWIAG
jgi:hypothetical protein